MISYSSGVLKPDCVRRCLVKEVFSIFETLGLKVVLVKELLLDANDVKVLYAYCFGQEHYRRLQDFMMSGTVVFYVARTERGNAIELLNTLVGATNPKVALPNTIRGIYGHNVAENVIHSTQNEKTFHVEIGHFLSEEERERIRL